MKHDKNITSVSNALTYLKREWTIQNLEIEIKISDGARASLYNDKERAIIKYSVNNAIHRKFFMHVLLGTYKGYAITAPDLLQKVQCSERKLETVIKECKKFRWIEINKCSKNHRHIKAMPILIETYENYTDWLWSTVEKSGLRRLGYAISELQTQKDSV